MLAAALVMALASCGKESSTTLPLDKTGFATSNLSGTSLMEVQMVYPTTTATGIPADSNIVLAFTKDVLAGSIPGNITIDGSISGPGIAYVPSVSGNIVTLNPTPTLNYTETITVNITTGVTATTGEALVAAFSGWFQVAPDGSAAYYPRVITGTNLPTGGGISKNTAVAQVTFSKAVSPVDATTVSILGGAAITGYTQVAGTNTWRFTLSGLAYGTTYTIRLRAQGSVPCVSDGTNCLVNNVAGFWRWTFTTENDPALPAMLVDSYWASGMDHQSALIYFTTSEYVDVSLASPQCRVQYGNNPGGPYLSNSIAENNWDGGSTLHILHQVPLTALNASSTYYYRAYVDTNGNGVWDAGEPRSAEGSFTTRRLLSMAAGVQNRAFTLQNAAGGGYAFWVSDQSGNDDIYGQYFNSAGVTGWTAPGGSAVSSHPNNQAAIFAIPSSEPVGAIVTFLDGTDIRGKHMTSGGAFSWAFPANSAVNQGILFNAGSDAKATDTPAPVYIIVGGINDDLLAIPYISTGDKVRGVIAYTIDGSNAVPVFDIDTSAGTFSNTKAVDDGSGNFMVFYRTAANVFVKSVTSAGVVNWPSAADPTQPGVTVTGLAGYTIVKVMRKNAWFAPYDAYVLASNGANVALVRVRESNGSVHGAWNGGSAIIFAGTNPDMVLDTTTFASDDRIIVVYRTGNYIEYRIYSSTGALTGPTGVTVNGAGYVAAYPKVALADAGGNDSGFYVSMFYDRNVADYGVYTSRFDAAGTQQWTSYVYNTAATGGMGSDFIMESLYWDDGGAPYGIIPIWQEYTSGTDLYYELVYDTGSYN